MFVLIAFLFEWRAAFISLIAIPLSLVAAAVVLDAARARRSTRWCWPGWWSRSGWWSTTPSSTWRTSSGGSAKRAPQAATESLTSIILHASLEVRSAILYATLINVVAVLPVVFVGGLTGAFFRPLALSYALAVLVSMVVALTVTPALSLDPAVAAARSSAASRPLVRVLKRGYGAVLARVIRRPRAAYATVIAVLLLGVLVAPRLGQELFPSFKERDFLMHWITKPGTSMPEERRIVTRPVTRCGPSTGVRRLRVAHRPGLPRRGDRRGELRRELDQRRPEGGLRQDAGRRSTRWSTAHPGLTERPDVPAGAHRRGADRDERVDRRPHLRRRPRTCCAEPRTRSGRRSRTCPASSTCTRRCRRRCPRSTSRPARGRARYGVKPGDVRRRRGDARRQRGGRRPLPGRPDLRRRTSGAPRTTREPERVRTLPHRHARAAGRCRWRRGRRARSARPRTSSSASGPRRRIDVGANVPTGRDLGR